jgi:cytoskeletal protein RodZ
MRPYLNLAHLFRHQLRGLLLVLPLVSGAVLLVALLCSPVGVAASRTLFQSPADTPTPTVEPTPSPPLPSLTPTQTAVPTDTTTATPEEPPPATATATPKPTGTRSAATATSSPPPTATLAPVGGVIQMPRLPSVATAESRPPTPVPTVASESSGSSEVVGGIVVAVLLVLAAGAGLVAGSWLRNIVSGS